jgi:hypothetical protein
VHELERREFLKVAAAAIGAAALPLGARPIGAAATGEPTTTDLLGGVTFGISTQARAGETPKQAVRRMERTARRRFDTVMNRMPWGSSPINGYSTWIGDSGRVPLLAWFSRKPSTPWAEIARGDHDRRIREEAAKVADAGWPCYFSFHKEPENEPELGDARSFRAAHDRVWGIFQDVGATNAVFVPTLMAPTFAGSFGGAERWLPPNFDAIGVDGYNRNIGGNWRSFAQIFRPAYAFATSLGRPLMIVESGCVEGSARRKGRWFRDALETLRGWPEVVHFSYNDEKGASNNDAGMNYRVDTSRSSVRGYRAIGADPYMNPDSSLAQLLVAG